MRYEVTSELNPKYYETFNHDDYCGLYHVVQIDKNGNSKIITTFDTKYDSSGRKSAYDIARIFNNLERGKPEDFIDS